MVYIRVKYSEDKELLANPNCPVRVLYNFIKNARSEAGADQILLRPESKGTQEESSISRGRKSSSHGIVGSHGYRSMSQRKLHRSSRQSIKTSSELDQTVPSDNTTDSENAKTSSLKIIKSSDITVNVSEVTVAGIIFDEREFDLCDENGQLKGIYDLRPWVNGFETGIFLDHALYIVVLFERDKNGLAHKLMPVLSRNNRVYSDLMIKIRRQLSGTSKQKLRGDKEKSSTSVTSKQSKTFGKTTDRAKSGTSVTSKQSKTFGKKTSNPSVTSSS